MSYNRQFTFVLIFALGGCLLNLMFNDGEIEWIYIILSASALMFVVPICIMAFHVFQKRAGLKNLLLSLTLYFFMVGGLVATFVNERNDFERKQEQFEERTKALENRDPRF